MHRCDRVTPVWKFEGKMSLSLTGDNSSSGARSHIKMMAVLICTFSKCIFCF